jgi:hypothetical protein
MLNSSDLNKDFGSYVNLQKRVLERIQAAGINEQILELVQKAYEDALSAEGVVLSRIEKKQLRAQVLKRILDQMSKGLGLDAV